jgi:hypothetical protein
MYISLGSCIIGCIAYLGNNLSQNLLKLVYLLNGSYCPLYNTDVDLEGNRRLHQTQASAPLIKYTSIFYNQQKSEKFTDNMTGFPEIAFFILLNAS